MQDSSTVGLCTLRCRLWIIDLEVEDQARRRLHGDQCSAREHEDHAPEFHLSELWLLYARRRPEGIDQQAGCFKDIWDDDVNLVQGNCCH
ncbi:hypothetical protein M3C79_004480 [Micrococcus luteus]|uniref:hypothetical protein n=1 Tax=Micrococcus sp. KRD128 TaxID=2729722 RepID=UPI0005C296A6|nr:MULTISPECIES: hypothetical protein [Micrococcus]MCV7515347.1 hypothetical protein [Micrococcus luteus]MCV7701193.1 hypothetical protein [Micrococcus luteus]MCV7702659.1 hypothetical protein [Micrococcus luteus]